MPTKKATALPVKNSGKKVNRKPQTTKKPVRKKSTSILIPKLPDVAPELKEHIVSPVHAVTSDSYWFYLAWFGVTMLGILIATGSATWLAALKKQTARLVNQPTIIAPAQVEATVTAPLTGLPATKETISRRPWAVVVENFVTVRPQAGLGAADIVFESPTEGGITRLLAVYQSQLPKLVGPIRSARSYFNDWIRPLSPFYSHSGGSDRALQQLRLGYGGIIDINEFFHGAAYARESRFQAPHNLFTTPERFFSYLQNNNYNLTSEVPSLNFVTNLPPGLAAKQVTIPYSPEAYAVTYEYQPGPGNYQRLVNGTTQLDAATNQVITVKNVVVMFTDITPIPYDPLLRVELRTLGSGEARIYTGGQVYAGFWRKATSDSLLEFIDSQGRPLPLQPGNTWVTVTDAALATAMPLPAAVPLQF